MLSKRCLVSSSIFQKIYSIKLCMLEYAQMYARPIA